MRPFQVCCTTSLNFLDTEHLDPLITSYELDFESLVHESLIAKHALTGKEHISDVLAELQDSFPYFASVITTCFNRDVLRFILVNDITQDHPEIRVLRFS